MVLASHHPSWTMVNDLTGDYDPGKRVLGKALVKELLKHDNVIAWVNGHTHRNKIRTHVRKKKVKGKRKVVGGFWEINTASHIDWPQQAPDHRDRRQQGRDAVDLHHDARPRRPLTCEGDARPTRSSWPRCPASSRPTTGRSATAIAAVPAQRPQRRAAGPAPKLRR